MPVVGAQTGHPDTSPGENQAQHIRQVVACIRQQGERIGLHPVKEFDQDEADVQRDTYRKCTPEAGRMVVAVVVAIKIMAMVGMMVV